MRISDWSSDVCSSDLRSRQIRQGICGSGGTCVLTRSRSGQVHRKAKGKSLARVIYAARALADLGRRTDFLLQAEAAAALETQSEERREGKECVSQCRSRVSPYHEKKKHSKRRS